MELFKFSSHQFASDDVQKKTGLAIENEMKAARKRNQSQLKLILIELVFLSLPKKIILMNQKLSKSFPQVDEHEFLIFSRMMQFRFQQITLESLSGGFAASADDSTFH